MLRAGRAGQILPCLLLSTLFFLVFAPGLSYILFPNPNLRNTLYAQRASPVELSALQCIADIYLYCFIISQIMLFISSPLLMTT